MMSRDKRTRVDSATDNTAQGVPGGLIKPVNEVVDTLVDKVFCAAEVEVSVMQRQFLLESGSIS